MLVHIVNKTMEQTGLRTVQAVDRAADLLKAVSNSERPASAPDLARTCGLNRSTAWRLLATLDRRGRPLAIVNTWGPSHRFTADRLPEVGDMTARAADAIRALIA